MDDLEQTHDLRVRLTTHRGRDLPGRAPHELATYSRIAQGTRQSLPPPRMERKVPAEPTTGADLADAFPRNAGVVMDPV